MVTSEEEPESRSHPAPQGGFGRDGSASPSHLPGEFSLLEIVNVLLRHRRTVVLVPAAVAFLIVSVTLVAPRSYTSTGRFMPESSEGQVSRLAGLASQFGINVPTGEMGQSPQFYADLILSRELLRQAVLTRYELQAEPRAAPDELQEGNLLELFEIEGESRRQRVDKAIEVLGGRTNVSTDDETGVVGLAVSTRPPELSQKVANRILELVNQFNLETRKTQAAAERAFLEEQVKKAESQLLVAEDSLEEFLEANRSLENSPQLRFERDRLRRRVDRRQQLYVSLSQSLEQARIQEVRNTPVITIVESPEVPVRPDRRWLILRGVLGLMIGGILAIFWVFGSEMLVASRRRNPEDYAEFSHLKDELEGELNSAWRRLVRLFRRGKR